MSTLIHILAVLNLPHKIDAFVGFLKLILSRMSNNAYFPTPSPTLASVEANLAELEAAEATAKTRAKGAAAERNLKWKASIADLYALRAYVQMIADANEDKAIAIIESAGMSARQKPVQTKADLAARMGDIPGLVLLRAKAAGKRAAYEWVYSSDGGKTWISLGLTNVASTSVPGLVAGTTYLFRYRRTVQNKTTDWSQVVSLFVH